MSVDPIELAHEPSFHIADVEVRPSTREIIRNGIVAIAEPRVMQVLVALHQADGQVVSKNDLIMRCWDGRVVGDDAINRVISRLRHNAEADAGSSFRIETITKVGYRLVTGGGPALSQSGGLSRRTFGRSALALAAAGALGGTGFYLFRRRRDLDPELVEIRRTILLDSPDQVENAANQLKQYVQDNPDSGNGWGLYAVALAIQSTQAPGPTRAAIIGRAQRAAREALQHTSGQADARVALAATAGSLFGHWGDWYRRLAAIERDAPGDLFVNDFLCRFYGQVGCHRLSLVAADRALAVEPQAPGTTTFKAIAQDNLGDVALASQTIEDAYAHWPKVSALWFTRLYLLALNGQTSQAMAMIDQPGKWPVGISRENQQLTRAQILALGDRSPSIVDDAIDRSLLMAQQGTGFAEIALAFIAALGRMDQFFQLAEKFYFDPNFIVGAARFSEEQRVYNRARNTAVLFRRSAAGLWSDPRFDRLVERIGLASFWKNTGIAPDFKAAA